MVIWQALSVLLIAYLPGALVFRLPTRGRALRASLPAEERVFWGVLLSLLVSSIVGLSLAAAGGYSLERLLLVNGALSVIILTFVRGRLRFSEAAPGPTWTALIPAALIILGCSVNFHVPPSEYIMGGKDPGVYMNEGIQIAQRGGLVVLDPTVATVPPAFRDLFFPHRGSPTYYSNRFMGFFLLDPADGTVISQFTHLYPTWIAIGYGVHGVTGARLMLGLWGVMGLAAVYFLGARLLGRPAALAGAGLLAMNVVQVWYARYPNAELVMQPLVFAGLLAYVRAQIDDDRFFAPVAGVLFPLTIFAHLTGAFVIASIGATAVLGRFAGQRVRAAFAVPLVLGTGIATIYLMTYLPPYFAMPVGFVTHLSRPQQILLGLLPLSGVLLWLGAGYPAISARVRAWVPPVLVAAVWLGAAYAFFLRRPGFPLAAHDADALRTFTSFYFSWYGLLAALLGFAVVARRSFWAAAPFLIVSAAFSFFFFYKIRIIPEHFWAARRFVAVILPAALLLAGAALFSPVAADARSRFAWLNSQAFAWTRYALGLIVAGLLGQHFLSATQPVLRHVEYAGLIPHIERIAATFGDEDLVVVESRGASDTHVLALPLAYIYARNVLVLWDIAPDKGAFREFLSWTRERYARVFFIGGGGTELLSRTMAVQAVGSERFQIPEYQSMWNAYPRGTRFKEFDFGIYEFLPEPAEARGFDLDVGVADDLYVRRFHAKERRPNGATFRWTRDVSYVSIFGANPECRRVTVWMGDGGRPAGAGAAGVELFLNESPLGAVTAGAGLNPHRFEISPDLAAAIARSDDAAQLRLDSQTWNPKQLAGGGDDRYLGVMVDRITIECDAEPGR